MSEMSHDFMIIKIDTPKIYGVGKKILMGEMTREELARRPDLLDEDTVEGIVISKFLTATDDQIKVAMYNAAKFSGAIK